MMQAVLSIDTQQSYALTHQGKQGSLLCRDPTVMYMPAGCMWHFYTHSHTQIFVVSDSRSGTCATGGGGGGGCCNKRAKPLSEEGLNHNQRGIKG